MVKSSPIKWVCWICRGIACLLLLPALLVHCGRPAADGGLIVPRGATLSVSTDTVVSTETHHEGDSFTATLGAPLSRDRVIFVPLGARVDGVVSKIDRSKDGPTRIFLRLTALHLPNGQVLPLETNPIPRDAKPPASSGAPPATTTDLKQTIQNLTGEKHAGADKTAPPVEPQPGNEVLIPAESRLVFTLASRLLVPPPS